MRKSVLVVLAVLVGMVWISVAPAPAADAPSYTRQEDVVYGRKDGMALTLDVLTPKKSPNGAALVWAVSGGWVSSHAGINPGSVSEFLNRGYTVFAVVHGSQPRYTIPDAVADMNRSVRYIRWRAKDFKIDPDRIGITGGSAGGHLSLMIGTAGTPGNLIAPDPVERHSSRVQAVACFFPPTDFLNYGTPGNIALGGGTLKDFAAPFQFRELDTKAKRYVQITDEARRLQIGRQISPVYHVTKDSPPTLIIHGDADKLVPIQQSELIMAKFKEAGVPAELVVKKGAVHGWITIGADQKTLADWFDKYLAVSRPKGDR